MSYSERNYRIRQAQLIGKAMEQEKTRVFPASTNGKFRDSFTIIKGKVPSTRVISFNYIVDGKVKSISCTVDRFYKKID